MDFDATRQIQPEMAPTERLLWSGRPPRGLRFHRRDLPTMLFGLAWTAFAVSWTWTTWQETGDLVPLFFGGAMVLVGLHQVVGRLFLESYARARTWYGVSDSRLVIVTGAPARRVESFELAALPEAQLETEGIDGGLIVFGAAAAEPPPPVGPPGRRRRRRGGAPRGPGLELDSGARSAYEIIRRAQQDARRARTTTPR